MKDATKKLVTEYDPADLIAALLKHPDLPGELRDTFGNVVTDDLTNQVDTDSPEILRAMLAQYKEGDEP